MRALAIDMRCLGESECGDRGKAAGSRSKQLIVLPFEAGHGLAILSGFNSEWSPTATRIGRFLSALR